MGIKRKQLGPQPIDKREEWQKLADAGRIIAAGAEIRSAGFSLAWSQKKVAEYLEEKRNASTVR